MKVVYVHSRVATGRGCSGLVDVTPELVDRHDTSADVRRESRLDLDRARFGADADPLALFDPERGRIRSETSAIEIEKRSRTRSS